ncbi:MAG: CvpA family protein [Proteobacteria bacterium]|nr:CvpA family protein [Pseudomonadota bacterium]MBU1688513.1 CvpA family protein [Pseudomonadota bacterium]
MTALDLVFAVLILVLTGRGIWTGLVRQAAFLVALPLGFWVAGHYYGHYGELLSPVIAQPQIRFMAAFVVLFLVAYLLVTLGGVLVRHLMSKALLGWVDRFFGGLFGLGKGIFVCTLLFMALATLISESATFLGRSKSYPFFNRSSEFLAYLIKDPGLREKFRPSEPAISMVIEMKNELSQKIRPKGKGDQNLSLDELRYKIAKEAGEKPSK